MIYSEDAAKQIKIDIALLQAAYAKLVIDLSAQTMKTQKGREYLTHGLMRRLKTINACVHNVFQSIPLEAGFRPSDEERSDATINIQAFYFNVAGALDNLAWIWVAERNVRGAHGNELPTKHVGLGKKYKEVWRSFSPELKQLLKRKKIVDWLFNINDFRHSLAHRIPLYIIPAYLNKAEIDRYRELSSKAHDFSSESELALWRQELDEQSSLGTFRPVITHSFGENANQVAFHMRLLDDFAELRLLISEFMAELNSLRLGNVAEI